MRPRVFIVQVPDVAVDTLCGVADAEIYP